MYQNYNYFQTQNQPQSLRPSQVQPQQTMVLRGRPVASIEEVKATTIDFDGSIFFFPDLANKRIYTKQINMDGTASLFMYELKEMPVPSNSGQYITREEFEFAINQLKDNLVPQNNLMNQPQKEDMYEF